MPSEAKLETVVTILETMIVLSRKFPTIELHVDICNGHMKLGIPKGPEGDAFTAAWGTPGALLSCSPTNAAH